MGATKKSTKKTGASKAAEPDPRSTTAVDAVVGTRLRNARLMTGMSQQALADELGITFQQIQKYEKGVNRISFGRMLEVARLLDKPVAWFAGQDAHSDAAPGEGAGSKKGEALPRDLTEAKLLRSAQRLDATQKRLLIRIAEAMIPDDGA